MGKMTNIVWFHLNYIQNLSGIDKIIETESKTMVTRGWGKDKWGVNCLTGYRVLVWDDKKVLEMDNSDGCTTMWMKLTSLNCTFKNY